MLPGSQYAQNGLSIYIYIPGEQWNVLNELPGTEVPGNVWCVEPGAKDYYGGTTQDKTQSELR